MEPWEPIPLRPRLVWQQDLGARRHPHTTDALAATLHRLQADRPMAAAILERLATKLVGDTCVSPPPPPGEPTMAKHWKPRSPANASGWKALNPAARDSHGKPTPGWKPKISAREDDNARATDTPSTDLANPRPPAVPATLRLNLSEYYAGAALMGLTAAQGDEPDLDWLTTHALDMGEKMAAEAQRRRKKG